jgi:quercetin dioxygenase-like cupin family protein
MTVAASIDVTGLELTGPTGAVWSLPHDGDLDANVVVVQPSERIHAHLNNDVDVLIVGLAGAGTVTIDDQPHRLGPGVVVHVPKGTRRAITADSGAPLVYLTVHRARSGLAIGRTTHSHHV